MFCQLTQHHIPEDVKLQMAPLYQSAYLSHLQLYFSHSDVAFISAQGYRCQKEQALSSITEVRSICYSAGTSQRVTEAKLSR
jgi:hypothetical protein